MMSSLKTLTLVALAFSIFLFGCDNDPEPVNDQETITVVTISFQETDATGNAVGTPLEYSWTDEDGDGGNDPVVDSIFLKPLATYDASLIVLNTAVTPEENITSEIVTEGADHQFFYVKDGAPNITFTYADEDANLKPIGVETKVETGAASHGALKITLIHLPEKSATGVSSGDITHAGGETDFESTPAFPLVIK